MDYRTKEEQVADFLREGILSGRFARGERLKQVEIAVMLKTSTTPVREALKLLAAEGYLSGISFKGSTVVPFDPASSSEILALRTLLEAQLVKGAMENMRASDLDRLNHLAAEFELAADARDSSTARAVNYRFHQQIYDLAAMPQTLHFVQILWARYPFDLITNIKGRAKRAAAEHQELLRHMFGGDVGGAMLTTRRHIETGWAELQDAAGPVSSSRGMPCATHDEELQ